MWYLLSFLQLLRQQLVQPLHLHAEAWRVGGQGVECAGSSLIEQARANLDGVAQPGIGQVVGKLRVGEFERCAAGRVGALLPPEQLDAGTRA